VPTAHVVDGAIALAGSSARSSPVAVRNSAAWYGKRRAAPDRGWKRTIELVMPVFSGDSSKEATASPKNTPSGAAPNPFRTSCWCQTDARAADFAPSVGVERQVETGVNTLESAA
jgi:hypothetical protein